MLNQKEAVFRAVTEAFNKSKVPFKEGENNAANLLTDSIREQVREALVSQFQAGQILVGQRTKNKLDNPAELKKYVNGLISNWVKKDSRLNGEGFKPSPQLSKLLAARKAAKLQEEQ